MKNPPEVEAMVALFAADKFDEALSHVEAYLATHPEIAMAWRFKGECLAKLGRYEEAIPWLAKAAAKGGRGAAAALVAKATAEWNARKQDDARATLAVLLENEEGKHDEGMLQVAAQLLGLMSQSK
jgi:tetratricopeptide (TPR) repeat protein